MITATAPRKRISCTLFESRVHFCAAEESEEGKLPEKKNRPTTREGHSNLHVKCLPSLHCVFLSLLEQSAPTKQTPRMGSNTRGEENFPEKERFRLEGLEN